MSDKKRKPRTLLGRIGQEISQGFEEIAAANERARQEAAERSAFIFAEREKVEDALMEFERNTGINYLQRYVIDVYTMHDEKKPASSHSGVEWDTERKGHLINCPERCHVNRHCINCGNESYSQVRCGKCRG
jgi:hypothetical protein